VGNLIQGNTPFFGGLSGRGTAGSIDKVRLITIEREVRERRRSEGAVLRTARNGRQGKDGNQDDERRGGVCAGGLGRFAADLSCFPTRLEKGGKVRIGREEKGGTQDQYAARSRS
jgi:hypothetical protein